MFGLIKAVIFDLDGTLVDTMPSVIEGLGRAVEKVRGERPETAELLQTFGPAPQDVLRQWMPEDRVPEALGYWLDFEKDLGPESTRAFEGVPEMLKGLKEANIPLCLFTGRDRDGAERILKIQGWWDHYFTKEFTVCGDDGLPTKPNPHGVLHLLGKLNLPADKVLMVGDHPHDMHSGKSAGAKVAAVLWDLPKSEKTHRANFKKAWESWNSKEIDLRLVHPGSLLEWIANPV